MIACCGDRRQILGSRRLSRDQAILEDFVLPAPQARFRMCLTREEFGAGQHLLADGRNNLCPAGEWHSLEVMERLRRSLDCGTDFGVDAGCTGCARWYGRGGGPMCLAVSDGHGRNRLRRRTRALREPLQRSAGDQIDLLISQAGHSCSLQ